MSATALRPGRGRWPLQLTSLLVFGLLLAVSIGVFGVSSHVLGDQEQRLSAGTRNLLAGSLAQSIPWLFMAAGLVTALLATAFVESLARRRSCALALVSERTRELDQTQAFLQRLLTAGPILVIRYTIPDRLVSYVSPNVRVLLGLSEQQAFAPGFLRTMVHPGQVPGLLAALARIEDGSSAREELEFQVSLSSGSPRWMSSVFVPEADDDGRVVAGLGYIIDVDARRRAEEARRQAQEAAESANRSKSQFLSRMSHELRTPLNAVIGFGQILELDDLNDEQREAVGHILTGGRHLLDLINKVLDVSHVEAGELVLSSEPVLAAELVQEAVDVIRPLADQRGIQLVVDRSGGHDCFMFADRQRVKQVLLNLLSNSVKYNRPAGTIVVSCDVSRDTRIRIRVADTGMGVQSQDLGLLFTPFERLGAKQTSEEGTGIGLALSRGLTEAMGGTLEVTSTPGQGSTFTVDLPRVEGPVERYERLNGGTPAATTDLASRRQVVLHIEDNMSNLTPPPRRYPLRLVDEAVEDR